MLLTQYTKIDTVHHRGTKTSQPIISITHSYSKCMVFYGDTQQLDDVHYNSQLHPEIMNNETVKTKSNQYLVQQPFAFKSALVHLGAHPSRFISRRIYSKIFEFFLLFCRFLVMTNTAP